MDQLDTCVRDPVAFIDQHMPVNELGRPWCLTPLQREVLGLAFAFDPDGRLPYDTIIYSCPKKSGKTTLNAALSLWWAYTQEPPNEIPVVANDLEQAIGRVFKAMAGLIRHNPTLARSAEVQASRIILSNRTELKAVAADYRGEAGGNHGLTSWDELWGYASEGSRRLWEELTPVPTRTNSIRLVTTYAGWEGESQLLQDLYKQGVGKEEHPEGQGERVHGDLPVYANPEARLFVYWDHEPRMPWQTSQYYESQRKNLRPGTFARLHENRWTAAETIFLTSELWDGCVDPERVPLLPSRSRPVYVGVDAGIKHDNAAVVAVYREGDRVILATHRIWRPSPEHPLDLEASIEAYLRDLHARYWVRRIACDPYQLHRSITTLQAAGLRIAEFPQTGPNTTLMGQTLFDLINGRNLRLYPAPDVREQALHTVAIETPRGWRIAKEKASRKIDVIVALALAAVAVMEDGWRPPPLPPGPGVFAERMPVVPEAELATIQRLSGEEAEFLRELATD